MLEIIIYQCDSYREGKNETTNRRSIIFHGLDGAVVVFNLHMSVGVMELDLVVIKTIDLCWEARYVGFVCEGDLVDLFLSVKVHHCLIT